MPPENEPAVTPAATTETREERAAPVAPAAPVATPAADASAARMNAGQAIDFVENARSFGVPVADARKWADELTPDAARSALLSAAGELQRAQTKPAAGEAARIGVDSQDKRRDALENALLARADRGVKLEAGREYRGMSLLEMARVSLEGAGVRTAGMSKRELASAAFGLYSDGSRMHTTSDFVGLLSNVANKSLRGAYDAAPQTFKAWMRATTLPDFKPNTVLQIGGAPSFLQVPEGGEFKMGSIGEAKEVYALATYGRIFNVSRQTLINDDMGAFTRIPAMFGRAAADFESDAAYAPVIANPNMGDGQPLFSVAHGNLASSGAHVGETTLSDGEVAMSMQTGIEGRLIGVQPKFFVGGTRDSTRARKLLTSVAATTTGDVNVWADRLTPVFEPRLNTAAAPTPWFLAADYNQVDTFEYAHLEGEEGVYLEEKVGFEVDGIQFKARTDFAVKGIDHRGLWKNPGNSSWG